MLVQPENFRSWIESKSSPVSYDLEESAKSHSKINGFPSLIYETSKSIEKCNSQEKISNSAYKTPEISARIFDEKSENVPNSQENSDLMKLSANGDKNKRNYESPYEYNLNNILNDYFADTDISVKHKKQIKKKERKSSRKSQDENFNKNDLNKKKKSVQKNFDSMKNNNVDNECQKLPSIRKLALEKLNENIIKRNRSLKQKYETSSRKFYDLIQYFKYPLDRESGSLFDFQDYGSATAATPEISLNQQRVTRQKALKQKSQDKNDVASFKSFKTKTLDYTSDKINYRFNSIKRSLTSNGHGKRNKIMSNKSADLAINFSIRELVHCLPPEFNKRAINENISRVIILKASCDYIKYLEKNLASAENKSTNFNIDKYFSLDYSSPGSDTISDKTKPASITTKHIEIIPSIQADTATLEYAIQMEESGFSSRNTLTD